MKKNAVRALVAALLVALGIPVGSAIQSQARQAQEVRLCHDSDRMAVQVIPNELPKHFVVSGEIVTVDETTGPLTLCYTETEGWTLP